MTKNQLTREPEPNHETPFQNIEISFLMNFFSFVREIFLISIFQVAITMLKHALPFGMKCDGGFMQLNEQRIIVLLRINFEMVGSNALDVWMRQSQRRRGKTNHLNDSFA